MYEVVRNRRMRWYVETEMRRRFLASRDVVLVLVLTASGEL